MTDAPDLFDPRYSLRKAHGECSALEDHMAVPSERCPDCITKHAEAIKAYMREAVRLDGTGDIARKISPILGFLDEALRAWEDGADWHDTARRVRMVRKSISPLCSYLRKASGMGGACKTCSAGQPVPAKGSGGTTTFFDRDLGLRDVSHGDSGGGLEIGRLLRDAGLLLDAVDLGGKSGGLTSIAHVEARPGGLTSVEIVEGPERMDRAGLTSVEIVEGPERMDRAGLTSIDMPGHADIPIRNR